MDIKVTAAGTGGTAYLAADFAVFPAPLNTVGN